MDRQKRKEERKEEKQRVWKQQRDRERALKALNRLVITLDDDKRFDAVRVWSSACLRAAAKSSPGRLARLADLSEDENSSIGSASTVESATGERAALQETSIRHALMHSLVFA